MGKENILLQQKGFPSFHQEDFQHWKQMVPEVM